MLYFRRELQITSGNEEITSTLLIIFHRHFADIVGALVQPLLYSSNYQNYQLNHEYRQGTGCFPVNEKKRFCIFLELVIRSLRHYLLRSIFEDDLQKSLDGTLSL